MRLRGTGPSVVAITGASGGLGSALAACFARRGARLWLSDVDETGLGHVKATLLKAGAQVETRLVDVGSGGAMQQWADEAGRCFGKVDLLINNAGLTGWRRFDEEKLADIDRLMNVNVRGVMYGCRAFLPWLKRADSGHIVNISSMIALMAAPMQVNYTASKWAIRGFSQALRAELAGEVGVTAVLPGTLATDLLNRAASRERGNKEAAALRRLGPLMRRFGTAPDYVAERVARAVETNRAELRVGWDSHGVALLQQALPGLLPRGIALAYRWMRWKQGGPQVATAGSDPDDAGERGR